MNVIEHNYRRVLERIDKAKSESEISAGEVKLIAVTKGRAVEDINKLFAAGARDFGENRVSEAVTKFNAFPERSSIKLHLIGQLQTNKALEAVAFFDCIHSLDRPTLAQAIAKAQEKSGKRPELFIQVNTGEEPQKGGIKPLETAEFIKYCSTLQLNVTGLMCIPPHDEQPSLHFALLRKIATENSLKNLSMGMSGDFAKAIRMGATHIRVGTALFEKNEDL